MKKYQVYLLVSLFFVSGILHGQSLQNIKAAFLDGKVIVTYDLKSDDTDQKYAVSLYSSHNNYTSPLTHVTGDVGKNVLTGLGRSIVWDAIDELDTYKGEIIFKVRCELLVAPLIFKTPVQGGSVRRGKKTYVQWTGGRKDQSVELELYEKGVLVKTLNEEKNRGSYEWQLPKNFKKGSYTLKLSSGSDTIESGEFKVKAKIPLLVKALPVFLLGGVVAILGGGGEKSANNDLPAAPGPQ